MQHSLPTQLPSTLPVFPEVNSANQLMLPAKKLQAARVSYHRPAKRLENQFHIREYQRDQEKQEAVRQAKAQQIKYIDIRKRRQHEERQRAS